MKHLVQLLLVCGIIVTAATTVSAGGGGDCAVLDDVSYECTGTDGAGRLTFTVSFDFGYVRTGTNFIRIYEYGQQGTTVTFPFTRAVQTLTSRHYWWEIFFNPVTFYIDVYDVMPNGKVVKCSTGTGLWINCGGPVMRPIEGAGSGPAAIAGETAQDGNAFVALAPNPATDVTEVLVDVPSYDPASSLDIIDLNGKVVASIATGMAQGQMIVPVQLNDLATGTYMVRMLHSSGTLVTPLQVIR